MVLYPLSGSLRRQVEDDADLQDLKARQTQYRYPIVWSYEELAEYDLMVPSEDLAKTNAALGSTRPLGEVKVTNVRWLTEKEQEVELARSGEDILRFVYAVADGRASRFRYGEYSRWTATKSAFRGLTAAFVSLGIMLLAQWATARH